MVRLEIVSPSSVVVRRKPRRQILHPLKPRRRDLSSHSGVEGLRRRCLSSPVTLNSGRKLEESRTARA